MVFHLTEGSVVSNSWILVAVLLQINSGSSLSNGLAVSLSPTNAYISSTEDAVFTCSYDCSAIDRYAMWWIVGDHMTYRNRSLRLGRVKPFIQSSKILVQVENETSCRSSSDSEGKVQQTLTISGDSSGLLNRTVVQCKALSDGNSFKDAFSQYGLVLLKPLTEFDNPLPTPASLPSHSSPSLLPSPSHDTPLPSHTSVPSCAPSPSSRPSTATLSTCLPPEVVTVVKEVTVTVSPSPTNIALSKEEKAL